MTAPSGYPRIPHLVGGRGTLDDLVLGRSERDELLALPLEVEEKLDGANVMVWSDDGVLRASGRAGPDSRDRAGQYGCPRVSPRRRIPSQRGAVGHCCGWHG